MNPLPEPSFRHVERLMGPHGLFEHAEYTRPRPEHGYCTDDNARLLVVSSRQPDLGVCATLSRRALSFVLDAQDADGRTRNRMDSSGRWVDRGSTDDCWGRSLWSLGIAAAQHGDPLVRESAAAAFAASAVHVAPSMRTMAFAALGAAEIMSVDPGNRAAEAILSHTLATIPPPKGPLWCWPEERLAYANAALAEAVFAAGDALNRKTDVERGLQMLGWLIEQETPRGYLSVTPAGGRTQNDRTPGFDQQPIEAASLADACARAYRITGDAFWLAGVTQATGWFEGDNDLGIPMHDPVSGGSFDGLHADRVNLNQGAESTLAYVSTQQWAHLSVGAR